MDRKLLQQKVEQEILRRAQEHGRKGGLATRRKYGKAHYRALALKRNALKPQKKHGKVIPSLDLTPPTPSHKI